jgi:glycosyltransferase involved in cell wall biosynthesis
MTASVKSCCAHNVGFVAARLAGTDGVSLEADKWAAMMEKRGCNCFYFAGELDTPEDRSVAAPEAHFRHPAIREIHRACFGTQLRPPSVTKQIHDLREKLKQALDAFIRKFELDLLVVENALSLPLNLPLGLAIAEVLSETGLPTIAHHHDFYWERPRLLVGAAWDFVNMAFPPRIPTIRHVVINSSAKHQLALRTGLAAVMIPNVLDFEHPPEPLDDYAADVREAFDIGPDEVFVLQPTRIVARKGIEHAVELVHRLDSDAKLVISHAAGDEEQAYERRVRTYSELMGVNAVFVAERMSDHRARDAKGRKVYAIRDVYPHADLVTYPSTIEGFGNAFLEAIYYRKPLVVNTYSVYLFDIDPKGFRTIEFDHYVTDETVRRVREVLENDRLREEMVDKNYELGRRHYSYAVLGKKLDSLLSECLRGA